MKNRKRAWKLFAGGMCIANGVVYPEWNLQVLWRADRGHVAEQLSSLHSLFETFPEATTFYINTAKR